MAIKHNTSIRFKISEEEKNRIKDKANEMGVTMSKYIRISVINNVYNL